ncbi:MAG: hypothetical protein SNJ81_04045 [Cyanobacteriota bacterium]
MKQGKTVAKRAVAKLPVKTQTEANQALANQALANHFRLHRRYHRSINLERDFDQPDAVEGYALAGRSGDALQRILTAIGQSQAHHAWILTGSYGTGKSAFALFLSALCAPPASPVAQTAIALARQSLPADSPIFDTLAKLPATGLLRAAVVGAREPLRWTIARALSQVVESHWAPRSCPEALRDVIDWVAEISSGQCAVTNQQVLTALKQVVQTADCGLLLIVDELGKNLEYAAQHRSTEDLYLLQQIAELGRKGQKQVYFLGLLHQSFVGYGERLSAVEQNEWNKIQGRFETLNLIESPSQMTRLIGRAIAQSSAIAQFVTKAKEKPQSIERLYQRLSRPPYGIKAGVIPVLLLAVLLYYTDEVSFYKDGTFVPILSPEHFELLVKAPERFAVKHIELDGLRSQVFKELETALRPPNAKTPANVRNASLLAVAKPLFGFVRQLPEFTRATRRLTPEALKVLQALQTAQEPDKLLFISLPEACGFNPMTAVTAVEEENEQLAQAFRKKLVQCLHEIQFAYDNLLSDCQKLLYEAFGVRRKEDHLREDLRVRASYLVGRCINPSLRHFVTKAVEEESSDRDWLEALVRIVADKHPKSWIDEDFSRFEIALSELVRRFQNLESLWTEVRQQGKGFDALRITVTNPNGQEVHEVVWIDKDHQALFDRLAEEVLNTPVLKDNPQLQKGFLAKLSEKLLSRKDVDSQEELKKPKWSRSHSA